MKLSKLSDDEYRLFEAEIKKILGISSVGRLLDKNFLLKVETKKRKYIHLLSDEVFFNLNILKKSIQKNDSINLKIAWVGIRLGFMSKKKFYVGIESIHFFSPYCKRKIILEKSKEQSFLYGRSVFINETDIHGSIISYEQPIMVFNNYNDPLGIGLVITDLPDNKMKLKNICDLGIYLRSEKTFFAQ